MAPASLVIAWLLLTMRMVTAEEYPVLEDEEMELNETVTCTNNHMEVAIPSAFFLNKEPPVHVRDLHLNDPECRGTEVGDDYVFGIKKNLSDCGTLMASDDSHIMFINTIHNNDTTDVITRNYISITFECRYPSNYMVEQLGGNMIKVDVRTITLNTEDGNFSVSMVLYKDNAFVHRWTTVPSLTLEENIFVKLFMIPAHLTLRLDTCWATPTSDPYSNIQYTFIRESCPALASEHTLRVLRNGLGPDAMFRIQMFKFVGSFYTNIFLHCSVQICNKTPGQCQPNCTEKGTDELTRIRRDTPQSHTVSYGPIRRLRSADEEMPNLNAGGVPTAATFVLGGLMVVLLVITGVFGRLWLRSRRFYPGRDAQLILSNVHHFSETAS